MVSFANIGDNGRLMMGSRMIVSVMVLMFVIDGDGSNDDDGFCVVMMLVIASVLVLVIALVLVLVMALVIMLVMRIVAA